MPLVTFLIVIPAVSWFFFGFFFLGKLDAAGIGSVQELQFLSQERRCLHWHPRNKGKSLTLTSFLQNHRQKS